MKNKMFYSRPLLRLLRPLPRLFAVAVAAVFATGCATPQQQAAIDFSNVGQFSNTPLIPVKDFESLGLVFSQFELQTVEEPGVMGARPNVTIEGEVFAYQALCGRPTLWARMQFSMLRLIR